MNENKCKMQPAKCKVQPEDIREAVRELQAARDIVCGQVEDLELRERIDWRIRVALQHLEL